MIQELRNIIVHKANLLSQNVQKGGNVMYGFRRFDLPLLVSYPRSGTNWIRYFLETLTQKPTPGSERTLTGNDFCIDRAHAGWKVIKKYDRVILVLRDYRECIIRQQGIERLHRYDSVPKFLNGRLFKQPPNWFIRNIESFEHFEGEKLLLYYEDIMQKPEENFKRLGSFMGIHEPDISDFLSNIEDHKKGSIAAYTSRKHTSETQGQASDLSHHSRKLSDAEIRAFDSYFAEEYPELFGKYLKRYISN